MAALAVAGCGEPTASDAAAGDRGDDHGHEAATAATFPADQATTEVAVTLSDYAFIGLPPTVGGPNVLFRVTVRGTNEHELVIVDGDGTTRGAIDPVRAADGEQTLAVVLPAGTYRVQCLVKEGTRTHAQLGMRRDLTVEAG